MVNRIIFYIYIAIFSSIMFSQDFIDRLRVPIIIRTKVAVGYDNNYLRLSNQEIENSNVSALGVVSTLDSPIIKSMIKFIYSPVIIDNHKTNVVSSISYSHFNQAINKSYFISNLSLELKLRSYSWIKLGIRDIPKYYSGMFKDVDILVIPLFLITQNLCQPRHPLMSEGSSPINRRLE